LGKKEDFGRRFGFRERNDVAEKGAESVDRDVTVVEDVLCDIDIVHRVIDRWENGDSVFFVRDLVRDFHCFSFLMFWSDYGISELRAGDCADA
jgi:hypothetical protein